jgi:glycosyltransferase involved in cell wall biosynthesis
MSVLIPAYNAERFIVETLDSVRKQSVQPEEVVVLDDASTDRTLLVIQTWSTLHNYPVTIFRHEVNYGKSKTRRDLTDYAKTTYVAFLSADDVWHKDFLKETLPLANNNMAVFSEYYVCDEKVRPRKIFTVPDKNIRSEIVKWALRKNMFVNFSCVLIPTRIFKTCQFQTNLNYGEDLVFLLDTVIHKLVWCPLHKPLLYYRVHEDMGTFKTDSLAYSAIWSLIKVRLQRLGVSMFTVITFYYFWQFKMKVNKLIRMLRTFSGKWM